MPQPHSAVDPPAGDLPHRPTNVRLAVVVIATAMSVLLYLDRFCASFAADFIKEDMQLTQAQIGYFLSAFFFSYALAQVPSGWLSDRYGGRIMLSTYILVWSLFTALIGAVHSLALLLLTRVACGLGQAGAYPTSASVLSKWVPCTKRGVASAWISLGGRGGGAIAPLLTAFLIVQFVPADTSVELQPRDLLHGSALFAKLVPSEPADDTASAADAAEQGEISSQQTTAQPRTIEQHIRSFLNSEQQETLRRAAEANPADAPTRQAAAVAVLNQLLDVPNLYHAQAFQTVSLQREAVTALKAGATLTSTQRRRFNRLLLEGAFPGEISKLYVRGWRPVMYVYGGLGIFVAALVWIVFRNRPEVHPWCNQAECDLIAFGRPLTAPGPHGRPGRVPLWRLLKSGSMWLSCLAQFGTNIGWVFLVTWLPRYLIAQHNVPILERGFMAMTPLLFGMVGMYAGGWLTDILAQRLGVGWGRRIPLSLTRFLAAAGYACCLGFSTFEPGSRLNSPWMYVAAFSLVSFSTDLGLPASWAFSQDVGGRYVGSILGWGNMWGNLGASCSPLIYDYYLGENPALAEWNAMFVVCLVAFLFSGLCGLGIDASIPIAPPDEEETAEAE